MSDIVERLRHHIAIRGGPAKDDDGKYIGTTWPMMLDAADEIERLRSDAADMQQTFDLQWEADMRAVKRWREAHPGNDLVLPDRANMVVWLMEQHDAYAQGAPWQPIATAPKDRFIFVYCPEDKSRWLVKWQGGEWYGIDAEHGIRRTGYSFGDPNVVTGWAVTHWTDSPALTSTDGGGK